MNSKGAGPARPRGRRGQGGLVTHIALFEGLHLAVCVGTASGLYAVWLF